MIVITVVLFSLNVTLAAWTILLVVPVLVVLSIWFHHASERGYLLVRDRIANVLADLSESLYGIRVVTSNNRQRRNIRNHRHVVGAYRDANLYTGRVNSIYGPATIMIGILGQGLLLGIGGDMVLHHQLKLGYLVAFFLYLNRFFAPIQLLTQQYTALQQGRSSIIRLRELVETPQSTRSRTRRRCPRSKAASPSRMLVSPIWRVSPSCTTSTSRSPRANQWPSWVPRSGQVDHGQTGQSLLRPDRGTRSARRHRHPHRHPAFARSQLGVVPQEPSSSPVRSAPI